MVAQEGLSPALLEQGALSQKCKQLSEVGKARKWILPWSLQEKYSPTDTLASAYGSYFKLLISRTVRLYNKSRWLQATRFVFSSNRNLIQTVKGGF